MHLHIVPPVYLVSRVCSIAARNFERFSSEVAASVMAEILNHLAHTCDRFRAPPLNRPKSLLIWLCSALQIILVLVLMTESAVLGLIVAYNFAKLIIAETAELF